jgi:magnesium chelatase family protein
MTMVSRYQKRVSGPLMDRIDIHVEVPAVKYEKLSDDRLGEPSAVVRARVDTAREIQRRRFVGTAMACNADSAQPPFGRAQPPFGVGPAEIRQFCRVDEGGRNLIKAATPALAVQVQVCSSCT